MPLEIEKKYLLRENGTEYVTDALLQMYSSVQTLKVDVLWNGTSIRQGYLSLDTGQELSARLNIYADFEPSETRLRDLGGVYLFTLKSKGRVSRDELEVEVSPAIFNEYWPKVGRKKIEKVRLSRPFEGHTVEIDVYTDRDLIVAEIEVSTIREAESLSALGKDVTDNKAYKNKNLAQ